MKKLLQTTLCILLVSALLLLTGCNDSVGGDKSVASDGSTDTNSFESSETSRGDTSSDANSAESDVSSGVSASDSPINSTTSSDIQSSSESSSTENQIHIHNYTEKTVAATCTTGGYTLKTCACGHTEKTNKKSALGHSFGAWKTVTAPTTSTTGSEKRVCSGCGTTETRTLDKLPQTVSEKQAEILRLVNIERQKAGLNPLQYYSPGQAAANTRAVEIAESFSHTRPNGTSCFTAFSELNLHYLAAGENIAYGQPDCASVMTAWMNSDGHRANILNDNFTHLVVGVYEVQMSGYTRIHWVQLFITPM